MMFNQLIRWNTSFEACIGPAPAEYVTSLIIGLLYATHVIFPWDTTLTTYAVTFANQEGLYPLALGFNFLTLWMLAWIQPIQMAEPLNQRSVIYGLLTVLQVAASLSRAHFRRVQIIILPPCYTLHNYIISLIMLDDKIMKIKRVLNQNKTC